MMTQTKRFTRILLAVGALLLIPLLGTLLTNTVDWDLFDFVVMGTLLLGVGLACDFVLQKVHKTETRIAIIIGILLVFFLIWAELAVGIFNSPFAGS